MSALVLEENCLVVPREDVLHVLSRHGTFEVRGRGIQHLHLRMGPYLHGSHGEGDLLAAVPPSHTGLLRAYLDGLRRAYALRETAAAGRLEHDIEAATKRLGASQPRISAEVGESRIVISLHGSAPFRHGSPTLRISFVPPTRAGRMLLRITGPELPPGRTTCVVVEESWSGSPPATELERRAGYARWLLHTGTGAQDRRNCLRLFRLGGDGTLRQLASTDEARSLAEQLELVRCAELDQVPLCIATASHSLFPVRVAAYGLAFPGVREHLLNDFAVQSWLRESEGEGFRRGELAAPWRTGSSTVLTDKDRSRVLVSRSLLELHVALAERFAEQFAHEPSLAWRETDLLVEARENRLGGYLAGVLRLRRGAAPARIARTAHGLFVGRTGDYQCVSLLRRKVLVELLLRLVWEEYYRGVDSIDGVRPTPACGNLGLTTVAELKDAFKAAHTLLLRERPVLPVATRRVRLWGKQAWAGVADPHPPTDVEQ